MYPVYKSLGVKEECKDVKVQFPPQHQECQPGLEYIMMPRPISNNPYSRGSGKLQGKVAIITGGDSGIGRAIAYAFAKEGADITISYLNEEEDACETKAFVEQMGRRCLLVPGDLKNEEMSKIVVEKTIECYGKIDILVNNAAVQYECKDFKQISDSQFDKTMKTNIYGTFYMSREALKHMKSGSCIINTASVTAFAGNEKLIDYSMTKGAIVTLTRSLSTSLAKNKSGIRVNAVAPGPIWTPLIPSSFEKGEIPQFGSNTPMGRAGQPVECAGAYVFLASEAASYITGQTIHINGGEIVNS